MSGQYLILDAPPVRRRPDDLLRVLLNDTDISYREPTVRSFGEWTFEFDDVPPEAWRTALDATIVPGIRRLHASGNIRYAEWN